MRFKVPVVLGSAIAAVALMGTLLPAPQANPAAGDPLKDFETVRAVFQHARCQNCHIPGDAPLQYDEGIPHAMEIRRGEDGKGAAGLHCAACHGEKNLPPVYGKNMPPGAPNWHLPPADTKMVFIGLSSAELCKNVKDIKFTGGKDLPAMLKHLEDDALVGWGWDPGVGRNPVPVPRAELVAKFKSWMDAGAPCPQ